MRSTVSRIYTFSLSTSLSDLRFLDSLFLASPVFNFPENMHRTGVELALYREIDANDRQWMRCESSYSRNDWRVRFQSVSLFN